MTDKKMLNAEGHSNKLPNHYDPKWGRRRQPPTKIKQDNYEEEDEKAGAGEGRAVNRCRT